MREEYDFSDGERGPAREAREKLRKRAQNDYGQGKKDAEAGTPPQSQFRAYMEGYEEGLGHPKKRKHAYIVEPTKGVDQDVVDRFLNALYELRLAAVKLHNHTADQTRPSRGLATMAMDRAAELESRAQVRLQD